MLQEICAHKEIKIYEEFKDAEQIIIDRAHELGLNPVLRGSALDRMISPGRTVAGQASRQEAFSAHRIVPLYTSCLPILPDLNLPDPWTMKDIKIQGQPPALDVLCAAFDIFDQPVVLAAAPLQPPTSIRKDQSAMDAWSRLQPKERVIISLGKIPEPPYIKIFTLAHTVDHFGLPATHTVKLTPQINITTLFDPPFTTSTVTLDAISITTTDSGDPNRPDLRDPLLTTNIDGLQASYEIVNGVLQPFLPDMPKEVTLSDQAFTFWNDQLTAGNEFAAYAVQEIAARAARKAAYYEIFLSSKTIQQLQELTRLAKTTTTRMILAPRDELKLRWEWRAAIHMNPVMMQNLLGYLNIPNRFLEN